MPGSIRQSKLFIVDDGSSATTIAATFDLPVLAGSAILAMVAFDDAGAVAVSGVTDGTAYTAANAEVRDTGNNHSAHPWYVENSTGGAKTVTATMDSTAHRRIQIMEVINVLTSGVLDKATGQFQATPGTGAGGVSSGATAATTQANGFIVGVSVDGAEVTPGTGTLVAGAGYQLGETTGIIIGVETKSVSATGAQTATFTQSVANARISFVFAFKEATLQTQAPRQEYPEKPPWWFDTNDSDFPSELNTKAWW